MTDRPKTPQSRMTATSLLAGAALVAALAISGCAATAVAGAGSVATTATTTSATNTTAANTTDPTTTTSTSTSTSTTVTTSPGRTRPATLTGPSAGAKPLVTVTDTPGFFCSARGTLVPELIVYDDGNVLAADSIGAGCQPIPKISAGWMDPATVRARLDEYFASPEASVDMSTLPVTDLGGTWVDYRSPDGSTQRVSAYGLGAEGAGMGVPDNQLKARAALSALIAGLNKDSAAHTTWTPTEVSVFHPTDGGFGGDGSVAWPLTLTTSSKTFMAGRAGSCLPVSGRDAARLVAANGSRSAHALWTVQGKKIPLTIGIVMPGNKACTNL